MFCVSILLFTQLSSHSIFHTKMYFPLKSSGRGRVQNISNTPFKLHLLVGLSGMNHNGPSQDISSSKDNLHEVRRFEYIDCVGYYYYLGVGYSRRWEVWSWYGSCLTPGCLQCIYLHIQRDDVNCNVFLTTLFALVISIYKYYQKMTYTVAKISVSIAFCALVLLVLPACAANPFVANNRQ